MAFLLVVDERTNVANSCEIDRETALQTSQNEETDTISFNQSINQSILSTVTAGVETFRFAKLVTMESPFSKTRLLHKLDDWFGNIGDCI